MIDNELASGVKLTKQKDLINKFVIYNFEKNDNFIDIKKIK